MLNLQSLCGQQRKVKTRVPDEWLCMYDLKSCSWTPVGQHGQLLPYKTPSFDKALIIWILERKLESYCIETV